jgi:F0F1-type ATP synthase delta subunit
MSNATQPQFFDDVARHYAGIFKDLPDIVLKELALFVQWINSNDLRRSLVKENNLPLVWYEALFQEFRDKHPCHEGTLRTLAVMSEHKRLGNLDDVLGALNESTRTDRAVYLHTAQRFSDTEVADFAEILGRSFGMPVTVHQTEKNDLLLGGVLLWNDSMIDLSLNRMLSKLHTEIDHVLNCS